MVHRDMTKNDFQTWLEHMAEARGGYSSTEAADDLGVNRNTIGRWKERGAPRHVALACTTLLCNLGPYPEVFTLPRKR